MVGGPEPDEVDFDASGYFRPAIFTAEADRARVAEAEDEAEAAEDLAGEFAGRGVPRTPPSPRSRPDGGSSRGTATGCC